MRVSVLKSFSVGVFSHTHGCGLGGGWTVTFPDEQVAASKSLLCNPFIHLHSHTKQKYDTWTAVLVFKQIRAVSWRPYHLKPEARSCNASLYLNLKHTGSQIKNAEKTESQVIAIGNDLRHQKIKTYLTVCKLLMKYIWMLCGDLPRKQTGNQWCSGPGSFLSAVETCLWRSFF